MQDDTSLEGRTHRKSTYVTCAEEAISHALCENTGTRSNDSLFLIWPSLYEPCATNKGSRSAHNTSCVLSEILRAEREVLRRSARLAKLISLDNRPRDLFGSWSIIYAIWIAKGELWSAERTLADAQRQFSHLLLSSSLARHKPLTISQRMPAGFLWYVAHAMPEDERRSLGTFFSQNEHRRWSRRLRCREENGRNRLTHAQLRQRKNASSHIREVSSANTHSSTCLWAFDRTDSLTDEWWPQGETKFRRRVNRSLSLLLADRQVRRHVRFHDCGNPCDKSHSNTQPVTAAARVARICLVAA